MLSLDNPPYLRVQGLRENFEVEASYYEHKFASATGRFDIYILFIERAYNLINQDGEVSFILPHKFMISDFGAGIRKFLVEKKAIKSIVHFGSEMIFKDASTYTCILNLSKTNEEFAYKELTPDELFSQFDFFSIDYCSLTENKWRLQDGSTSMVLAKLDNQQYRVKDLFDWISQGTVSTGDDIFLIEGEKYGDKFIGYSSRVKENVELESKIMKPLLKGEDIKKYSSLSNKFFLIYPHYQDHNKTIPYEEEEFKTSFPKAYQYLAQFKDELVEKKIKYKTNSKYWYGLHRSREISLFEQQEKIITPEISLGTNMTLDANQFYHNTKCYSLIKNPNYDLEYRYLLSILNSSVMWFFLKSTGYTLRGGFFTFKTKYLEPFPLPVISNEKQKFFIEKVDAIINQTSKFDLVVEQLSGLVQNKFQIKKLSKKLQAWYKLDFPGFLKELKKAKIKLKLSEESEWNQYFGEQKQEAQDLKSDIIIIDKEIDNMVFDLYGLDEKDIIVIQNECQLN